MNDSISRQAAINALNGDITVTERENAEAVGNYVMLVADRLRRLPPTLPDRELIDDYMLKIKQSISLYTAAERVVAINYYLEQIYEQIYGEGEKPNWMS